MKTNNYLTHGFILKYVMRAHVKIIFIWVSIFDPHIFVREGNYIKNVPMCIYECSLNMQAYI